MLHAICSILELEPFILRVICSILELNLPCCMLFAAFGAGTFYFACYLPHLGAGTFYFYHAICRICAQEPFSLRAIC